MESVRAKEGELSLAKHRLELAERGLREQEALLQTKEAGGGSVGYSELQGSGVVPLTMPMPAEDGGILGAGDG